MFYSYLSRVYSCGEGNQKTDCLHPTASHEAAHILRAGNNEMSDAECGIRSTFCNEGIIARSTVGEALTFLSNHEDVEERLGLILALHVDIPWTRYSDSAL